MSLSAVRDDFPARRTGVAVKDNVVKDADGMDNLDDFWGSPQRGSPRTVDAPSSMDVDEGRMSLFPRSLALRC